MNTTDQNKLIAEFMGARMRKNGYFYDGITFPTGWNTCRPENMKYNTSWDWLMPVVECIRTHCIDVFKDTDKMGDIFRGMHIGDIESTHLSCVSFIQWYNENK